MTPKGFALLAGATAVSLALAAWAVADRDLPLAAAGRPEPMFPGLLDRLNDVRTIRVAGADPAAAVTLERDQGGTGRWVVRERGGYPAEAERARELALGLANLSLVEPKTARPERLARLELEDPATAGAKSRRVELLGEAGETLAAAVVGKTRPGLYGAGRAGVYVRRAGDDQAWLAAGELPLPTGPSGVIPREIVDLPAREVARVTLGAGGPAPLVVVAGAADVANPEPPPTLQGTEPPAGRTVDAEKLGLVLGSLSGLVLQDVRPLAEANLPADAPRARFEAADGVALDVTVATTGEGEGAERWLAFTVAGAASAAPPAAPTADGTPPATAERPPAERAAELKGRLEGWAYKVPEYLADRLTWDLDDLLAEPADGTS